LSVDLHALVPYVVDVAEAPAGGGRGLIGVEATALQPLGAHREVKRDLVVDVDLRLPRA
jgi:hypothetical protein